MDTPTILIVEDDEEIRMQMKWALAQDFEVVVAEERQGALQALRKQQPSVVTLDLGLPPHPREVEEGFRALNDILQNAPHTKVIVVTGQEGKEYALEAIGQGAYDFLRKPIELDELRVIIRRALHVHRLEREHRALQQRVAGETFEEMVGNSPQMQEVFATIRKVATAEVPVLIVGESGTGKELVARAIHRQSLRRHGAFVAINCGAIPENLLESELFGHEKGAFTGAHMQRQGRVEMAQEGTLFLDEVGDLPLLLQVKLLRFLQEHVIERVGGRQTIPVDTRVVAATNADLQQAMADGRFREDLFYRLGVVVIALPPLRERSEDILLLAQALLNRYAADSARNITGFTRQAVTALQTHGWPGNVRELENRIKRAVIMAQSARLTPADLDLISPYTEYERQGLREAREALEQDLIRRALTRNKGNITRTASELGVSRPTLHELVAKYAIER
ncbi:MAG: PEP-CTERM-box response regulator transcription factor [Candidatus Tectomicrobia bacterium]|nr:PEP-CTERM-box response regulator transcription factor [Candidatus Tectomicrobia bacterium]